MSKLSAWKVALGTTLVLSSLLVAQQSRPAPAPKAAENKPITSAEVEKLPRR